MALFKSRKCSRHFRTIVIIIVAYVVISLFLVIFTFLLAFPALYIDPTQSLKDKVILLDAIFIMNLIFLVPPISIGGLALSFINYKVSDKSEVLKEDLQRLTAALKSPDKAIRLSAISEIRSRKFVAAIGSLIDIMRNDPYTDLRQASYDTMKAINRPVEWINAALKSPDMEIRSATIKEIDNGKHTFAYQGLTDVLLGDPSMELRLAAYDTLKEIGHPMLGLLLSKLEKETNSDVKLDLLTLLREIRDPRQIDTLIKVYVKDGDKAVKLYILETFSYFYSDHIQQFLVWAVNNERYADLKVKAIEGLVKYKSSLTEETLKHLLFDPDPGVRDAANESLKHFEKIVPDVSAGVTEIVKVPCSYCGSLVEITMSKCPVCGAPFKP